MKIISLLVLIHTMSISFGHSQDTLHQFTVEESVSKTPENKNIGISHITSDIISFSQLRNSHELTIENMPEWEIISYDLTSFIPEENSVRIYAGRGSEIPDSTIQEIIASGANKILFENIVIFRKGEIDMAGVRNFYLN